MKVWKYDLLFEMFGCVKFWKDFADLEVHAILSHDFE